MTEERHIQDDDIQGALTTLLHQLQAYDVIQNYQLIEAQAKDHPALQELIERIKAEQKMSCNLNIMINQWLLKKH